MEERLRINLQVAEKVYPLKVRAEHEPAFRKAAHDINDKLSQYKSYFTGENSQPLDDIDYMAMTAIQAVASKAEVELRAEQLEDGLKKLNRELDEYLEKNVK